MTIIFRAKTQEAYVIKILAELFSNNLKTGCFVLSEEGIFLCMPDSHNSILIDINLKSENFKTYKFNTKKMYIGINLAHLHRMTKFIKKKDQAELFIDSENPNELQIKVIPKENNKVVISSVTIQNIQNIEVELPSGYTKPVIVNSSDFQKLVKEMNNIGNIIKVKSSENQIEFSCNAGGILKRQVKFGECDEDADADEEKTEFTQEYLTEHLSRITKLSGLSNNMQIYHLPDKPLKFVSNVGSLGKISIFIKSKDEIEKDNLNNNAFDSEYDSE